MAQAKYDKETKARILLVEEEAVRVFGSPTLAKKWMAEPNQALSCSPLQMLESEAGLTEVRRILGAIAYGGAV